MAASTPTVVIVVVVIVLVGVVVAVFVVLVVVASAVALTFEASACCLRGRRLQSGPSLRARDADGAVMLASAHAVKAKQEMLRRFEASAKSTKAA